MAMTEDIDLVRSINWALVLAERALGLPTQPDWQPSWRGEPPAISPRERCARILRAATAQPGRVDPEVYRMVFALHSSKGGSENPTKMGLLSCNEINGHETPEMGVPKAKGSGTENIEQQAAEKQFALDLSGPEQRSADDSAVPTIRWAPMPGVRP